MVVEFFLRVLNNQVLKMCYSYVFNYYMMALTVEHGVHLMKLFDSSLL